MDVIEIMCSTSKYYMFMKWRYNNHTVAYVSFLIFDVRATFSTLDQRVFCPKQCKKKMVSFNLMHFHRIRLIASVKSNDRKQKYFRRFRIL